MEEKATTSVFVMVNFINRPYGGGLYEVKIKQGGEIMGETHELLDHAFSFFDPNEYKLPEYIYLEGVRFGYSSKLYLMPIPGLHQVLGVTHMSDNPYNYVFDTKTKSFDLFSVPQAYNKSISVLMSAYGKLYNLADPCCFSLKNPPNPLFECYDPDKKTWESLDPYPYDDQRLRHSDIMGYAVCYGCILVSIYSHYGEFEYMVYHIASKTWHQVNVPYKNDGDDACFSFRGRAVVVEDKIYGLSVEQGKVVTFTLRKDSIPSGRVIYSLGKPFIFPCLESGIEGDECCPRETEYLVHLGKLNFCLVHTVYGKVQMGRQHVRITTFQIVQDEGGRMPRIQTLYSDVRDVDIEGYGRFTIGFGFTPEVEDFEPEEEETSQAAVIEWAANKRSKTKNENNEKEDKRTSQAATVDWEAEKMRSNRFVALSTSLIINHKDNEEENSDNEEENSSEKLECAAKRRSKRVKKKQLRLCGKSVESNPSKVESSCSLNILSILVNPVASIFKFAKSGVKKFNWLALLAAWWKEY